MGATTGAVVVQDEGSTIASGVPIDFVGAGVTVTLSSGKARVSIPGGGGGGSTYDEVPTYADLPVTVGTPTVGTVNLVQTDTGSWWNLFTKKKAGLYRRTADNGVLADWTYLGVATDLTLDSSFGIQDQADGTKMMRFEIGGFTTGREAIITPPDQTAIAMVSTDATQTLTNKTLTAPVINSPTGIVKADVGLGSVTNDAQTKAAIVPNTAPSAGQLLVGNAGGTAYGVVSASGDVTVSSTGAHTIAANAVSNAKAAQMATNTVKVNATGSTADAQDLAFPASRIFARLASGDIVAATVAQIKTLLAYVAGDVGLGNVDNTSNATERAATATLTNKRITSRVQSVADAATVTPNADSDDCVDITAIAQAFTIANPSGTPTNFQKLIVRIKDNGTARAITFGAGYAAGGVALPTTTVLSKILTLGFIYNTANTLNKWQLVASAQEA